MWIQILIVLILGGGAYAGYQYYMQGGPDMAAGAKSHSMGPATVEIAISETRQISEIVEAVGTTRAFQSIEIVPEATGRIEEIAFTAGQVVEKDDVLIRLDNVIARADVAQAQAQLLERDSVQRRLVKLRNTNAVTEAAIEDAMTRLVEAQSELDRAEQRLSERVIRAPFAGTVGLPEVDLGARVGTDTVITRLDDLSQIEVEFSLPETRFAQVKPGQEITGTSSAFGDQTFAGRIVAIDTRIDPVSRSFRVRAVIPNSTGALPSGMFMSLDLVLSQSDWIVIPEEALMYQGEETYIYVVTDGKAERRVVTPGKRQDGMVTILSGLEADTQVVTRGLHRVRDGGEVEILNADAKEDTGS